MTYYSLGTFLETEYERQYFGKHFDMKAQGVKLNSHIVSARFLR